MDYHRHVRDFEEFCEARGELAAARLNEGSFAATCQMSEGELFFHGPDPETGDPFVWDWRSERQSISVSVEEEEIEIEDDEIELDLEDGPEIEF